MLLTVDIGNTTIALGIFRGEDLVDHWRISSDLKKTADEYAICIRNLFSLSGREPSDISGSIIESVVPPLTGRLAAGVKRISGKDPFLFNHNTPIDLENRYEIPEQVGMDRLANAAGAKYLWGAPIIIVDFGTAITLDFLDREGAYAGGVILPGLEMSANALFRGTSRLPRISLVRPPRVLGTTTDASMQSGLFFGTLGAVESLIERLWEEAGYKTRVVATGGGASEIARGISRLDAFEPFLTLKGLNAIWHYNQGA